MVFPADYMRYFKLAVVDNGRKIIERLADTFRKRKVAEKLRVIQNITANDIADSNTFRRIIFKTNNAFTALAIPMRTHVARRLFCRALPLPFRLKFGDCVAAEKCLSFLKHFFKRTLIHIGPLALAIQLIVPKPKPCESRTYIIFILFFRPLTVGIFNAQYKNTFFFFCKKPVKKRGSRGPDMKAACRRGRDAYANTRAYLKIRFRGKGFRF